MWRACVAGVCVCVRVVCACVAGVCGVCGVCACVRVACVSSHSESFCSVSQFGFFLLHLQSAHHRMIQLCSADVAHMLMSHFGCRLISVRIRQLPVLNWTLERSLVTSFPRRQRSSVNTKTLTTGSPAHAPFPLLQPCRRHSRTASWFHSLFISMLPLWFSAYFPILHLFSRSCLVLANIISPLGMLSDSWHSMVGAQGSWGKFQVVSSRVISAAEV